jgi:hypothetical protein
VIQRTVVTHAARSALDENVAHMQATTRARVAALLAIPVFANAGAVLQGIRVLVGLVRALLGQRLAWTGVDFRPL